MTVLTDLNADYALDPTHTNIGFEVRHAMITKVRGHFEATGTAHLVGSDPAASNVSISLDVASVDTGNKDRDAHLTSPDFFDVAQFPTIDFRSTAVALSNPTEVEVTGDLTIHGTTRQVVIPMEFTGVAVDPFGNERVGFEGGLTIKRSDFGLTWNAALETGGVLVSDKVNLVFDVSLIKA
ncbi:MAG: YceI family protein [Propionibacteriaceae bacterium]|nr:YceI family protein [Propionibacteriaceae bacterium]